MLSVNVLQIHLRLCVDDRIEGGCTLVHKQHNLMCVQHEHLVSTAQ